MCSNDVCLRFICSAFLMAMLMADVLLAANPKRGLGANEDVKITVCEQSSLHSLIPYSPSFPSPPSKQVFLILWMRLLPVEHSLLRVIMLLLIEHLTLGYTLLPSPSFLPGDLHSFSLNRSHAVPDSEDFPLPFYIHKVCLFPQLSSFLHIMLSIRWANLSATILPEWPCG